ncbi:MAG: dihydrodipicolinate synthase family protein, partial [Streptosporangiales bacterium]
MTVHPAAPVRGVSPVLAVPFTPDGEVALDDFRRLVRHVLSTGVTSVMFPGLASEFYKLSEAERVALRDVLLAETTVRTDVAAVISVSDHATHLAARSARAVVQAGADVVNLLPPHFLGPSADALAAHIGAVLAAIAPTPVVVQCAPAQTGTSLDASVIAGIAREHSNLRMVKVESAPPGRFIAALGMQEPPLAAVVGQAGVQMLDAARRGAVGVQPGCSFSELYVDVWR